MEIGMRAFGTRHSRFRKSLLLMLVVTPWINPSTSFLVQFPRAKIFSICNDNARIKSSSLDSSSESQMQIEDEISPPKSVAIVKNPHTQQKIYLIGCLHGAPSSKEDVAAIITSTKPAAVVLELCKSRFKALSAEIAAEEANQAPKGIGYFMNRWASGVVVTYKQSGMLDAFISGFLSSAYLMQKISKFDPGSEFKEAIKMSAVQNYEVVLGDQDVQKTLKKFGSGFRLENLKSMTLKSLLEDLAFFSEAVSGPPCRTWPESLNVFEVIFLQPRLLKDLILLLAPITVAVYALTDGLGFVFDEAVGLHKEVIDATTSVIVDVFTDSVNVIMLGFSAVFTSKFFRSIIAERNECLAESIFETSKNTPNENVVAVVGLLHCNGVAECLRSKFE